jgi:hypothetical protein
MRCRSAIQDVSETFTGPRAYSTPRLALLLSTSVAFAGCATGGGEVRTFDAQNHGRYTPEEVAQEVGLVADDTGVAWTGPLGCHVNVIITTRHQVQTYVAAGDPVVTNRRGDVGFRFGEEPGCRARLRAALDQVE